MLKKFLDKYPGRVYNGNTPCGYIGGKNKQPGPRAYWMEGKPMCKEHSSKTRERSANEYRSLMNRLSRIEGQIRGIRGMLEKDAYCIDVLAQAAAANAALNAFSRELLAQHLRTCVARDLRAGDDSTVDELVGALQKLLK